MKSLKSLEKKPSNPTLPWPSGCSPVSSIGSGEFCGFKPKANLYIQPWWWRAFTKNTHESFPIETLVKWELENYPGTIKSPVLADSRAKLFAVASCR